MASTYSSNLKIELMATGENSGTWGTITNTNMGTAVEEAIVGYGNPDYLSDANLTLTISNSNETQTARALVLNVTSGLSLTATRELVVPTAQKPYVVQNNTTGSQSILVKTTAGTGITVPNGFSAYLYTDGTNVVQMADFMPVVRFNSLLGNGGTSVTAILDEDNMASDSATALATQQSIKAYVDAQVGSFDTLAEVLANGNTTGGTDLAVSAGDDITFTSTSNAIFADNGKAIFGAGSDLQIYHDGSNSYITDAGTGKLNLRSDGTGIDLQTSQGETMLRALKDSYVRLYYDNAEKLDTTATGIDVTGTVVADGLTVDGLAGFASTVTAGQTGTGLYVLRKANTLYATDSVDSSNNVYLQTYSNASYRIITNNANRLIVDGTTGDISFYEDTGTTAKFFWDASAESLGIGTSSPEGQIDIYNSSGTNGFVVKRASTMAAAPFVKIVAGSTYGVLEATGSLTFRTSAVGATPAERMRIDSSGNVGIGTSSPTNALSVTGNANITGNTTLGDASTDTVTVNGYMGVGAAPSNNIAFQTGSTTLAGAGPIGILANLIGPATATTSIRGLVARADTAAASFTVTDVMQFQAANSTKGAGSTITNQHGLYIADQTQGTNNYGITSLVSSGTNKWNIYASGTAANYFAGNVGIGTTVVSEKLTVGGGVLISGTSSSINYNGLVLDYNTGTGEARVSAGGQSGANAFLTFTTTSGGTEAERLRITSAGNVGIGTTSPTQALTVNGQMLSIASSGASFKNITPTTGNNYMWLGNSGNNFYVGKESSAGGTLFVGSSAYAGVIGNDGAYPLQFATNNNVRATIDSSGNLGLGVTPSAWATFKAFEVGYVGSGINATASGQTNVVGNAYNNSGWKYAATGAASMYQQNGAGSHSWLYAASGTAGNAISFTSAMTLDASGNLLVGKTTSASEDVGVMAFSTGRIFGTADSDDVLLLRRNTTDGDIAVFRKDGTTVGSIGSEGGDSLYILSGDTGLRFSGGVDAILPCTTAGAVRDNAIDLGTGSSRFDDIYATNPTIQTSDRNEKQDIETLSETEARVAVACKGLLRKFRWKDAVAEKGDEARIHFGIIAQDLQDAFSAEGLDAGRYAMFISSTWWETQTEVPAVEADEENGIEAKEAYTRTDTYETAEEAPEGAIERTRLGVRYPELLAFIIAAI